MESTSDENTVTHSLVSASTYSIAEIFKNVNTADKHFLKYLPDGFLSEEQIKAKQEALAEDRRRIDAMPDKEQGKKETITPIKNLTKEQKDVVEAGKRLGREVVIADIKLGNENIDGLFDGKILYINPNPTSGNPMFTLLKHELTHFTQISSKYRDFSFAVTDSKVFSKWLNDKGFKNSQEYIAKIISDQKQVGKNWDNEKGRIKARREMVANFVGDVLFAEDGALERFVNTLSPDHKRTFGELVRDFIAWIKKKLGMLSEIEMLEQKYAKLFKDAKKVTEKGVIAETNSSQYKLSINFAEDKYFGRQIDKFETLKQGGYITVGEIVEGSPLNKVGIPYSTLYFDVSKILQEMKGRSDAISREVIKEIPNVLNNPIVITEYVDKNGMHSVNVYGNLYIGSSPVVVGVMITQTQKGNIISKIQTVHANRHALNEMTDDNILYLSENTKETKSWFQSLGTQKLPLGGNKFGFIRSISQSDAFVNTKDKKISETDDSQLSYTPAGENGVDNYTEEQYNDGTAYSYTPKRKKHRYINISQETLRDIMWELRDVYGDVKTAVADEVAVALGNTVYVVDSGRENGKITCRAIEKIIINDKDFREEYIRRTNYDALSKGCVSDGLSARFRRKYAGRGESDRRSSIRQDLQTDNGKSANNQEGVSERVEKDADIGGLKDGERPYSYTPSKAEIFDELIKQYNEGLITEEKFKERIVSGKSKNDPVSVAKMGEKAADTTPDIQRRQGKVKGDGERDTIIAKGKASIFSEEFKKEVETDEFIQKYKTITNEDTLKMAAEELDREGNEGVQNWLSLNPVRASVVDIVKGFILLDRYRRLGNVEGQVRVAQKISDMGTAAGQFQDK